ncbi:class I histocompatibility antigen, F10 alpha chain-like protein [Willisornis vidua]|uniref:Class I histocompatibility antigen, F10 alpha chain-like protein n=1 Tax=Willisornis vidua TaxID=1566151 RepID=A0ABQ9DW97_9PASS|nr:class I histocompatibility antigen, F10 alpha chain-like protein [Willisornis vidua]
MGIQGAGMGLCGSPSHFGWGSVGLGHNSRGLCGSVSPPGLHTWQWISGCDLLSDGTVRGSERYGYDERDFISFELGSKSFVAADSAAQVTKRRWEHEGIEVERTTNYLGHICPEWLRKYIEYGREALERKGGDGIPIEMWDLGMEDLGMW